MHPGKKDLTLRDLFIYPGHEVGQRFSKIAEELAQLSGL